MLSLIRPAGRAFKDWQEGPLSFAPTFKFKRGTTKYMGAEDEWRVAASPATSAVPDADPVWVPPLHRSGILRACAVCEGSL